MPREGDDAAEDAWTFGRPTFDPGVTAGDPAVAAGADAVVGRMLAELAVAEHGRTLPRRLAFLGRLNTPPLQLAAAAGGAAVLSLAGLLLLWLVGLIL